MLHDTRHDFDRQHVLKPPWRQAAQLIAIRFVTNG